MKSNKQFAFRKNERITGKKKTETLFAHGKSFISYPLRVVYIVNEQTLSRGCSILISVPKKRIKKAVQRNRIKRLIRESYRLNKDLINSISIHEVSIDIAFIYVKDVESKFSLIQKSMRKALIQISDRINKTEQSE